MTKRDEQKLRTHAKLVQAAQKLFRAQGWVRVGIRDIGREAGVSAGAIMAHWPTKEALWREAMGYDWPDPAGFARWVRHESLRLGVPGEGVGEPSATLIPGAHAFLLAHAGQDHHGPLWAGPKEAGK